MPRSLFLADDRVGGDDFSPSAHKWGIGGGFHLLPAAVTFWGDFPLESFSQRGKEVKEIGEIRAISKGTLLHPSWPAAGAGRKGSKAKTLGPTERERRGRRPLTSLLSTGAILSPPLSGLFGFPLSFISPAAGEDSFVVYFLLFLLSPWPTNMRRMSGQRRRRKRRK